MPYTTEDVKHKTKKAKSEKRKRQWVKVYESARASGKSEGTAHRMASGVVKKTVEKKAKRKTNAPKTKSKR